MSLESKSADADERSVGNDVQGGSGGDAAEEEASSAIAAGIRRDVKPWLNLVDDLSNLTRDAEISVPQVGASLSFSVSSRFVIRFCVLIYVDLFHVCRTVINRVL